MYVGPQGELQWQNVILVFSVYFCPPSLVTVEVFFMDKCMLFRAGYSAELLAENDQINELDEKTLEWWKEMGRDTRTNTS